MSGPERGQEGIGVGKAGRYAYLLASSFHKSIEDKFLNQAASQVAAAGSRHIIWCFAEEAAAKRVRELFAFKDEGRERIQIEYIPAGGR